MRTCPALAFVAFLASVAALSGCASSPSPAAPAQVAMAAPAAGTATATPASAPRQVCVKERPTGSQIPQTVCRPVDDNGNSISNVQATVDDLNRQTSGGMSGRNGGGH